MYDDELDDELDIENPAELRNYLEVQGHGPPGGDGEHQVLAGGVSGRTVWVRFADGREWVLKQALPKLRVQADWFSDPARIHREALGMQTLATLTPPGRIPQLIFDDLRHHVIGMEAVPRPHENWKSMLLAGDCDSRYFREFGKLLAAIHTGSRLRREELQPAFADRSFFETLRIEPYYEFGARQEPRAADFYRQLIADTRANPIALVHGDYSPKNILIYDEHLVLLDHEVIHWGDPAFDVGFALSHLLSKGHHVGENVFHLIPEFWESYWGSEGNESEWMLADEYLRRCVRHALGCLLARVVGRSPLEYLTPDERNRQREAVVRLLQDVPADVPELIEQFQTEVTSPP